MLLLNGSECWNKNEGRIQVLWVVGGRCGHQARYSVVSGGVRDVAG